MYRTNIKNKFNIYTNKTIFYLRIRIIILSLCLLLFF